MTVAGTTDAAPDEAAPTDAASAVDVGPAAGVEPSPDGRWVNRLAVACVVAAVLPLLVAAIRAVIDDWVAVGDDAYFALRAQDVLTEHHPWLGSWTSASATTGINTNNPGPLYFDLLALPTRLAGDAGLAVGVALLNVASVLGIAAVARRVAGPTGVVVAMLAATGLGWAMGSALLVDPWQPHALVFPFLAFLMLTWAMAAGDLVMLPWAAGVASLLVQTHVGYAVVIPLFVGWAVVALGLRQWRARRDEPETWPDRRRRLWRVAGASATVAALCWAQPLYEQLVGPGRGNLGLLAEAARVEQPRVGLGESPRYLAEVLAFPPWWGRPSFTESVLPTSGEDVLPSRPLSVLGVLLIVGVLVVALAVARRWRERVGEAPAAAVATGLVGVAIALVSVTTLTVGLFDVAAHHVRWLWPLGTFVTFAVVLAAVSVVGSAGPRSARLGMATVATAVLALALANLPAMNAEVGPPADAAAMATIRGITPGLRSLDGEVGVYIDLTGQRFAEPYTWAVMSELQRLGVPWYTDDTVTLRQVGPSRELDGKAEASVRLYLREGEAAREEPPGAERIAFYEGETDLLTLGIFVEPL